MRVIRERRGPQGSYSRTIEEVSHPWRAAIEATVPTTRWGDAVVGVSLWLAGIGLIAMLAVNGLHR